MQNFTRILIRGKARKVTAASLLRDPNAQWSMELTHARTQRGPHEMRALKLSSDVIKT